jgi:lysophospholipase L1-like esterase
MVAFEAYARLRGVYRQNRPPHMLNYKLAHWPPDLCSQRPIVAFGDSMTEGIGAVPDQSYPAQLERLVGHRVINAGRSGETVSDALARLDRDVLTHNPALVLLCLGGNDLIQRVAPEQTMADLRQIIRIIHGKQIPVLMLGLRGSWLLKIDHDGPTRQIAREEGCPLVPLILDGIWGVPWRMAEHVHPNARGYGEIARRVHEALRELEVVG